MDLNSELLFLRLAPQPDELRASGLGHDFQRGLKHMGGCQNYGPFLGTLTNRCRIIKGTQKKDRNFDNHPHDLNLSHLQVGRY